MRSIRQIFLAALACVASVGSAQAESWSLDASSSQLTYGTIKNGTAGEVNWITPLSGSVSPDGEVEVILDLTSLETNAATRNTRMAEHVFEAAQTATITAQIDMDPLERMMVGNTASVFVEGTLTFLGREIPLEFDAFAARLGPQRVLVTTDSMFFLSTEDAGVDRGVDVLQELANLADITRTIPISFRLVFASDDQNLRAPAFSITPNAAPVRVAVNDARAGRRAFQQCRTCHAIQQGRMRTGPSLYGIVDSAAGVQPSYNYSSTLISADLIWTEENLTNYMMDPQGLLPGNAMEFQGVTSEAEASNIIAYLREVAEED